MPISVLDWEQTLLDRLDGMGVRRLGQQRPLWLLSVPKRLETREGCPHWHGRLKLQASRERIESGWWDGRDVARDYFIATNPSGSCYWIYRELAGERYWYLQGIFE
ncbi:MAG TPA: hypothetical protein ENI74_01240 [Gammaproteobacteria bacterium]|nr:hypothetical protein [Gammaproteobacteria bacterium]